MNEIVNMYTQELHLKIEIINNILTIQDKKEGMLYMSCWINEPYINLERLDTMNEILEYEFC